MKCPSCAKEGKDVEMEQSEVQNLSSDYVLFLCPKKPEHWEVRPKEAVPDDRK